MRSGNSTRQLKVDEATHYVMHRWPLSMGATVAAQFKAVARFSGQGSGSARPLRRSRGAATPEPPVPDVA